MHIKPALFLTLLIAGLVNNSYGNWFYFYGKIGDKFPVQLCYKDTIADSVSFYFYENQGKSISLASDTSELFIILTERNGNGKFKLKIEDENIFNGVWRNSKNGKEYPVLLHLAAVYGDFSYTNNFFNDEDPYSAFSYTVIVPEFSQTFKANNYLNTYLHTWMDSLSINKSNGSCISKNRSLRQLNKSYESTEISIKYCNDASLVLFYKLNNHIGPGHPQYGEYYESFIIKGDSANQISTDDIIVYDSISKSIVKKCFDQYFVKNDKAWEKDLYSVPLAPTDDFYISDDSLFIHLDRPIYNSGPIEIPVPLSKLTLKPDLGLELSRFIKIKNRGIIKKYFEY